jgi:hypothetical protein
MSYLQQAVETNRLMTIRPTGITPERAVASPVNVVIATCFQRESRPKRGLRIRLPVMIVTCDEKGDNLQAAA